MVIQCRQIMVLTTPAPVPHIYDHLGCVFTHSPTHSKTQPIFKLYGIMIICKQHNIPVQQHFFKKSCEVTVVGVWRIHDRCCGLTYCIKARCGPGLSHVCCCVTDISDTMCSKHPQTSICLSAQRTPASKRDPRKRKYCTALQ